jgi:hypothetical protein
MDLVLAEGHLNRLFVLYAMNALGVESLEDLPGALGELPEESRARLAVEGSRFIETNRPVDLS